MNMKRTLLLALGLLLAAFTLSAQQEPAKADGYRYVDAATLPVFGKVADNTAMRYSRLPASLKGVTRGPVWSLGLNSAGVYVRFRTDSPSIRLRWKSLNSHYMNHMSPTGDRGLDLYIHDGKQWRFAGSGRPAKTAVTDVCSVRNMEPGMKECMVHLSLYDGVEALEIGIEEGTLIEGPALDSPSTRKPVIMYGTSILQGGCVTRPGMAFTHIIARRLDREVINLGFSGNAHLDPEIAQWMAAAEDPGVFVLDNAPNCTAERIEERTEAFFRILRDAHPKVPVIFVEQTPYPFQAFDLNERETLAKKAAVQRAVFERIVRSGEKNVYYVKADRMLGPEGDDTVDGTHLTDLGAVHYADLLTPVIKKALKKNR